MTVAELEGRMSGKEFAQWRALDSIRAQEQHDAALVARQTANVERLLRRG